MRRSDGTHWAPVPYGIVLWSGKHAWWQRHFRVTVYFSHWLFLQLCSEQKQQPLGSSMHETNLEISFIVHINALATQYDNKYDGCSLQTKTSGILIDLISNTPFLCLFKSNYIQYSRFKSLTLRIRACEHEKVAWEVVTMELQITP